jgi:hypothetical protein
VGAEPSPFRAGSRQQKDKQILNPLHIKPKQTNEKINQSKTEENHTFTQHIQLFKDTLLNSSPLEQNHSILFMG